MLDTTRGKGSMHACIRRAKPTGSPQGFCKPSVRYLKAIAPGEAKSRARLTSNQVWQSTADRLTNGRATVSRVHCLLLSNYATPSILAASFPDNVSVDSGVF